MQATQGDQVPRVRLVVAASGAARLEAAEASVRRQPPGSPILIVGATREAADALARRVAATRAATFGIHRFSVTQLAARLASTRLAGQGVAPVTALGFEALASRAAFEAADAGDLAYVAAVAGTPGFPRAVSHTLRDLREAGVTPDAVRRSGVAGADMARLLERVETLLASASLADRTALFEAAIAGLADDPVARLPLVLLDVPVESAVEARFATALVHASEWALATVPAHDVHARAVLLGAGGVEVPRPPPAAGDLGRVQSSLFADAAPPPGPPDGSVECFSAPGEGRECAEIARRILHAAANGVRFDEMAVLVRATDRYQGLLEHAFARAGVPAWFERGVRRPNPAGRALLALLSWVEEGWPVGRFAEYLSLGQVPPADTGDAPWLAASDDLLGPASRPSADREAVAAAGDAARRPSEPDGGRRVPVPRHWERLLVESSVIGGSPDRWARRLDGLAAEIDTRLAALQREDADTPHAARVRRDRDGLAALRAFVLPLVRDLAAWPAAARWGEWLDRLAALAARTLRAPHAVLRVVAELRPMAAVGPVPLADVRRVLGERLRGLDVDLPAPDGGQVVVGTPALARGRAFRVVFVPGLAERLFPRRSDEDPLLLDEARRTLGASLATRADRQRHDRLLLHLAVGAATERLHVSYPRLDPGDARPRVPSFYALDLLRGATGRLPNHEELTEAAADAGDRLLSWPAPEDPARAIDDQEHDLAVLRRLLDAPSGADVRGRAQYLLRLEPALRRSVSERWLRAEPRWSSMDGLVRVTDRTAPALAAHRLTARPYSISALQRFAVCPYQFLLGAIYRLAPVEMPGPISRLDPLTRGVLVHRIQMLVVRALGDRSLLPVTHVSLPDALDLLETTVHGVAATFRDDLAPAIERVWREEIAALARDLQGWLRHLAETADGWTPHACELAFGLRPGGDRDPRSHPDPVPVDGRFPLRGAIDLIERHVPTGALRVTDYKTGRNRTSDAMVIDGGRTLQPVLYALAVEYLTGQPVAEARLFFCTATAGYVSRTVAITDASRRAGIAALEVIDRAIAAGCLPPAPAEGACRRCEFRSVCGPDQESRVRRKAPDLLRDLEALRRER